MTDNEIIANLGYGLWRIEIPDDGEPQMFVSPYLKKMLAVGDKHLFPDEMYKYWRAHILEENIQFMGKTGKVEAGDTFEILYKWDNPETGMQYIRLPKTRCIFIPEFIQRPRGISNTSGSIDQKGRAAIPVFFPLQKSIINFPFHLMIC